MDASTLSPMSEPHYAPRLRPERLIAAGRVVLAAASLFAVWLDPDEPIRYAAVAYGVLVAYLVYAIVVAGALWRAEAVSHLVPPVTHAVDLLCFSLFIFFTDPASPFTVYYVFALLAATVRWQVRGTVATAVVVIGAFFGFGLYFGVVLDEADFELRGFVIRGVYLFVLAGLLGYVGTQDRRAVREMSWLAAWPETVRHDTESLARDLLEYAAPLLAAPKVVLAWSEVDTPWRWLATWDRGSWTYTRQPADVPLVHPDVRDRAFISQRGSTRRTMVQEVGHLQLVTWPGDPLEGPLVERFAPQTVLSVPIQGETFAGRLFVLDKTDSTLDDLVLGEIVAGVIAARLDACYLTERLRQASATEERIRLARDLHDGVLQSFTGVALRLAAVRRMMDTDRAAAARALEDAQRMLASEQRDLRFFIQELTPTASTQGHSALQARVNELAERMEREWDLRVDVRFRGDDDRIPAPLARDVYHIIREALVNAARHGSASHARVTLEAAGEEAITVAIADNGRGFPFTGRYGAEDLAKLNLGPKTLRERVGAMNGRLVLESSPSGAELSVMLPLAGTA